MLFQGTTQSGGPTISINKTVELIGGDSAINDILQQDASFSQSDAGTYDGILLQFNDSISVSGTFTYNGSTHTFSNKKIANAFGIAYYIPSTSKQVVIAKGQPVTIRLIFDVENAVFLANLNGSSNPQSALLDDGKTSVLDDGLMMMPFIGTQAPTIEKYLLKIQEDTTTTLTLTIVRDGSGSVCNFGWKPCFNVPTGNSPPVFVPPEKVIRGEVSPNTDGSYDLAEDMTIDPGARKGHIPAFRLENHSGLIYCSAESGVAPADTFHYTATKDITP